MCLGFGAIGMQRSVYTLKLGKPARCPSGGQFDLVPWMAFHGTSNLHEKQIESEGLCAASQPHTRRDVADLCAIFDSLHWCGDNIEGVAVLKGFSVSGYDMGDGLNKATYFHRSAVRALLYATPSRAGGEEAMAMRNAFCDIENALRCPTKMQEIREQAWRAIKGGCRPPYPPGCAPESGQPVLFCHLHAFWSWWRQLSPHYALPEPRDITNDWPHRELQR
jgi:hypothetical protein